MHAKYWNDTVLELEKQKKALLKLDQYLEIKYEDMVTDPQSVINKVLLFAGLTFPANTEFKEAIEQIHNKNYKKDRYLSSKDKDELQKVMNEALQLKGYLF